MGVHSLPPAGIESRPGVLTRAIIRSGRGRVWMATWPQWECSRGRLRVVSVHFIGAGVVVGTAIVVSVPPGVVTADPDVGMVVLVVAGDVSSGLSSRPDS